MRSDIFQLQVIHSFIRQVIWPAECDGVIPQALFVVAFVKTEFVRKCILLALKDAKAQVKLRKMGRFLLCYYFPTCQSTPFNARIFTVWEMLTG